MTRSAIIIGADGQDGTLLRDMLRNEGYRLACVGRETTTFDGAPSPHAVDISRMADVTELVRAVVPDEIYHLAAVHHASQEAARLDVEHFRASYEVNFFSLLHFLEAARQHAPHARLFYAASSLVFGDPPANPQTEATPFDPQSAYAMTKVDGILACRQVRKAHGFFASTGILYNHESRLREERFLTRKVIRTIGAIHRGAQVKLPLGDLSAIVDWGYAPDYVEAMHAILQAVDPDDFIIATGTAHTVRDFVEAAFGEAGLDWRDHVLEEGQILGRPPRTRIGDSTKLTRTTGWRPRTSFEAMIRLLVREELGGPAEHGST